MTITQILYALAVAEHKNFSRAAESQFVSQPALSQQIRLLEKELGYPLFIRSTHAVQLTDAGRSFCLKARSLETAWLQFIDGISALPREVRRLRIGMGSRVYSNHLFEPVVQFYDAHPELEVTFVTEAGHDFLAGLRDGELDLALDRMPPIPLLTTAEDLVAEPLIFERQCVLTSRSDPKAAQQELRIEDLRGCTVMTGLENSMEDRVLRYDLRNTGMVFNRIYRSDSIETNMSLIRAGKGILIGPESFADYYGVAAVPLNPKRIASLDFICLQRNALRPAVAELRTFLRELCHPASLPDAGESGSLHS
ncbi:MAG: LysR family transcriptional regulator [Oscillospiraceae bacterium]|nr:LysR family transcriptional regulator [Oscillospiraceae bacterium]